VAFTLPPYVPPDFHQTALEEAPTARFAPAPRDGVAPEGYHATSIYPEYLKLQPGEWHLLRESRMDCVVVLGQDATPSVREFRHLKQGDPVACGREENGEEGILVHTTGFPAPGDLPEKFAFRTQVTRETSFSFDYDALYDLLEYERDHGFILWVLGPAVAFDRDSRRALVQIIAGGHVHGLLAGNALAVHDLEAALFGTALGQEIYSKRQVPKGHYKHLDAINTIRFLGSMEAAVSRNRIPDGIMRTLIDRKIPTVLAGSIRDDGPLPEVIADAYRAQDQMRTLARRATTVVAMATQLHAIAVGNMLPSYHVTSEGRVRPVYFYSVDMSEFAINKLANRGSLTAHSILTNVQDFIVMLERGLRKRNSS